MVVGSGLLGAGLLSIPVGLAADRFGDRRVLALAALSGSVGLAALLPLAHWSGAFIGSILFWSSTTLGPVMNARVTVATPRHLMARAMGSVFAATFLGSVVASPLAGPLSATLGPRAPLVAGAGSFFVAALVLASLSRPVRTASAGHVRLPRRIWPLLAFVPLSAVIAAIPVPLLPLYLRDVTGIPLERIGLHVALMGVGTAAFAVLSGRIADAVGAAAALLVDAIVLTAGALVLVLASGSETIVALSIFLIGANLAPLPVLAAAVEPHLPSERSAVGYATVGFAYALGVSAGTVLAGSLYEGDATLPYLVTAALALPVATMLALAVRHVLGSIAPDPVLRSDR